MGASWINYPNPDPNEMPAGKYHFRRAFTIEQPLPDRLDVLITADNTFVARINGQEIGRSDGKPDAWKRPVFLENVKGLKVGENLIEIEVENTTAGPTALLANFQLWRGNQQTAIETDTTWEVRREQDTDWTKSRSIGVHGVPPWGKLRMAPLFLPPPRVLSSSFRVKKPVSRAVLYATAFGIYACEINGRPISDEWFAPGWTDYRKRLHYRAYDVAALVNDGENNVQVLLADGWFAGHVGSGRREHYGDQIRFSAMLHVEYEDGTSELFKTDESWRAGVGLITQADLLMGESTDYSVGEPDWHPVVIGKKLDPTLEPYPMMPSRTYAQLHAMSISEPKAGTYVFDLGQNFAGVSALKLDGAESGTTVTLKHGETLAEDGTVYTENLRGARCTDVLTLRAGDVDWTPKATFHGFRYVQVEGLTEAPLQSAISGLAISNINKPASSFECSDPRLNQLWSNVDWTFRSNFIEIPTDCPQRDERLGWTGDIQVFCRTATVLADVQQFLNKWLVDLEDAQGDDGNYPKVAPVINNMGDGGPAWAEAGLIVPWALYEAYGDKDVLDSQWDSMVRFMDFCESRSEDGAAPEKFHCFGDWVNVNVPTRHEVIFTAYYAHSADLMARIANVLGKDARRYETLFEKARETFVREFMDEDGTVEGDTQTGYILAIGFGLLDEPLKQKATAKFVRNIEQYGHLTTGFVGTRDLLLVLRDIGRTDVAYKLLLSDEYPGWLFSVKHGATTIWERWNGWTPEDGFANPGMNSFSHYAYGAVGQFMFETIGGIRVMEPGFKKFLIAPVPGPLTSARATYDSVRGHIVADWKIDNGLFELEVSVPPNSEAVVRLPSGSERTVGSGVWRFDERSSG